MENKMETKELKIVPPEGYVIDKENSTFECIKFKPKNPSYKDIADKLFKNNTTYYTDSHGSIKIVDLSTDRQRCEYPNRFASEKQAKKLLALNKLINVAKYLNEDWEPDFDSRNNKYYIAIRNGEFIILSICFTKSTEILFKSAALAKQAIEILGEETIELALSQV